MTLARFLGTAGGLGLSPVAPGTAGTLAGLALAFLALQFEGTDLILLSMAAVVAAVGVPLADAAEKESGQKDPGWFVVDEVAGYLVAVFGLPLHEDPLLWLGLSFLVFRVFDVWKPFPIRRIEKRAGGVAVIADDLVAGVYSNAALRILVLVL